MTILTAGGAPEIDFDLTSPSFNTDPFGTIDEWRQLGPVVYNRAVDKYLVLSYAGCSTVLSDLRMFDSQAPDRQEHFMNMFGGLTMEALDSPRHNDMRNIWATSFDRKHLEFCRALVETVVSRHVDEFAERVRSGETVDVLAGMTRSIPTAIIARLLGVPDDMTDQFARWSDAIGQSIAGERDNSDRSRRLRLAGALARQELTAFIADAVAERRGREEASPDLIAQMVFSEYGKTGMSEEEIIASNVQLVFAGNETTANVLALAMVALALHPDQRRAIRSEPSLVPAAFEELHRWNTLTQTSPRNACSESSTVDGYAIPDKAEVWPLIGAANRDPSRWPDPHRLDVHRQERKNLGFGFGMHICLGQHLARLEGHVWLRRILEALPDFDLAAPVDYGTGFPFPHRGPASVLVTA